jgi:hypothetical protein
VPLFSDYLYSVRIRFFVGDLITFRSTLQGIKTLTTNALHHQSLCLMSSAWGHSVTSTIFNIQYTCSWLYAFIVNFINFSVISWISDLLRDESSKVGIETHTIVSGVSNCLQYNQPVFNKRLSKYIELSIGLYMWPNTLQF